MRGEPLQRPAWALARTLCRRMLILLLVCCFLGAAASGESAEEIFGSLDHLMRSYDAVGASVIVAREGEILLRYVYGMEDRASGRKVSLDTHFRIASVTKMISAIRVMQLVEEGKLDLDQDISAYLGYPVRNPYKGGGLTLRMLMSHTSSLGGTEYRFPGHSLRKLIGDGRRNRFTKQAPGKAYQYCNFGAGLMGSLIEIADGRNADESVKEGVFRPLGIDAGYSIHTLGDAGHVASLYNKDGMLRRGPNKWSRTEWDGSVDPEHHFDITVGDLLIRPEDLCRLGMTLAAGGALEGTRLLRPETAARMTENQQGLGGIEAETPYGLCVHREENLLAGHTLYGHQGHMWGTLCSLYWEPETRFTVLVVSNGCNTAMDHGTSKLAQRVWELAWRELWKAPSAEAPAAGDAAGSAPGAGELAERSAAAASLGVVLEAGRASEDRNGTGNDAGEEEDYIGRLIGVRIGIDPGHQAEPNKEQETVAPGSRETKDKVARGTRGTETGIPEYETDLAISFALREALIREGAVVFMTRETHDVNISNQERAKQMNEAGAQLVLRIHCNGSSVKTKRGIALYVNKSFPISGESRRAAECILPRMAEATGAKARGVFRRDTYTGLNWSEAPAVLVECGYMTNPEEDLLLNDLAYQRKLAEGMVEGVCDYFGR